MSRPVMRMTAMAAACMALAAGTVRAQDIRHAEPPPVAPVRPAAQDAFARPGAHGSPAALSGESVILAALKGVVVVPDADPAALQRQVTGVDASAVPLAQHPAVLAWLGGAVGQPASLASLERLAGGIRQRLREAGQPFVSVWLPPQDLTAGTVRIAVRPAVVEGPVQVIGATVFSEASYLRWMRQSAGQPVDLQALQEDLAWINRNPFRNATLAAEPGSAPGATRLALRVREQGPVRYFAGAENNGTRTTGRERVFAGVNWGNVLGRGDQAGYQFRADPRFQRSVTHSGTYQVDLPWRHALALSGAWSRSKPDLGPDFRQQGTTWQLGARYLLPNAWAHHGWEADLTAGLDWKFADNNLEFAAMPVVGNVTRIAQAVLAASLRLDRGRDGDAALAASLALSPGGASGTNSDAAFNGSRAGAPARYAYLRIDGSARQRLFERWAWNAGASLQWTGVALLGSEQLVAGGAAGPRGYPELAVSGDRGLVLTNELRAPAQVVGPATAEPYLFLDAGQLQTRQAAAWERIDLASAGFGADIAWDRSLSVRVALGWPLRNLPGRDVPARAGHVRLQWTY